MRKINILVIPSDNIGGVGFYRSTQPNVFIDKNYSDEFSVTITMSPIWADLHSFDKYDIIYFHKGLYQNQGQFIDALKYFKENNIVTIMDIDDHWKLNPHHPQYLSAKRAKLDEIVINNFKYVDYVTTTTPLFAKIISKYNKNVMVFPNAIDPTDSRFSVNKKESDKIRIGMIMGSTHKHDMEIMGSFVNKLPQRIIDRVQFVLCGFDLRGSMKIINQRNGEVTERPLKPKESVWYEYEKMITNDYKIITEDYKKFLELFVSNLQYPNIEKEAYKRCWTKDINHYYEHFSDVDVLLAPLEVTEFNYVKSQLKAIECCFSHTALIASDYGPYTIDLKSAIEKGGTINPNGNALLVDESKNHKLWVKYIEKLVDSPELLTQLQNNIYNSLHDKFDLKNVCEERVKFYKSIVKKDLK